MVDFAKLHKRARHDIRVCIQAWSETLRDVLGDKIEFMYAKGSGIKRWDTPIDYVPLLSDVDIHLFFKNDFDFFTDAEDHLERSLEILTEHEERFRAIEPDPLHFPRSQLVILNKIMKEDWFVPPRLKDIQPVFGEPHIEEEAVPERIRFVDRWRLEEIESFLQFIPLSLVDRSGPDYWNLVRRMSWRVSPAPVRLLTQTHPDPGEVWGWNRTRVLDELAERGLEQLASHYRKYYEAGWDLFLSDLKSTEAYRQLVFHGYHVMRLSLETVRRL